MESSLAIWWLLFLTITALDIVLWTFGCLSSMAKESRYRTFTIAALLLYVVLGMLFGWGLAAAIWLGGLWVYAIVAGSTFQPES